MPDHGDLHQSMRLADFDAADFDAAVLPRQIPSHAEPYIMRSKAKDDALTARLAEAEALLRHSVRCVCCSRAQERIAAFLAGGDPDAL